MLGGVLLGIIEIFAKAFNTNISDAVVFAVLIVVLLVKPSGLLGKYVPRKCEVTDMKTRSLRRKRLFGNLLTYCIVAAAFVILQLLNAGGMLSPSLQGQLVPICAYVTMAVH